MSNDEIKNLAASVHQIIANRLTATRPRFSASGSPIAEISNATHACKCNQAKLQIGLEKGKMGGSVNEICFRM
jgi:hypothetical protein